MTSVKVANVTDRGFPLSSLPSENIRLIKRHDMLRRLNISRYSYDKYQIIHSFYQIYAIIFGI